jgi:WD40 repeat protein
MVVVVVVAVVMVDFCPGKPFISQIVSGSRDCTVRVWDASIADSMIAGAFSTGGSQATPISHGQIVSVRTILCDQESDHTHYWMFLESSGFPFLPQRSQ